MLYLCFGMVLRAEVIQFAFNTPQLFPAVCLQTCCLFSRDTASIEGFTVKIRSQRPVASGGLRDHLFHESRCVNKKDRKKQGAPMGQPAYMS